MNDMTDKIIKTNEQDLIKRKRGNPVSGLEEKITRLPQTAGFKKAIEQGFNSNGIGLIAEVKLASPSEGEIENSKNVVKIAGEYKDGGADAISIITEKYFFKGDINFINRVENETSLPILQKDFVVDPYQIYESRAGGAEALLLIAKIISPDQLKKFVDLCLEIGLEPVVEINDELDLENALQTDTGIIAVNARDLNTFKIDIEKACELVKKIPGKFLKLGFSGVSSKIEVDEYRKAGAKGVLVGTKLMKSRNKRSFLSSLRSESKEEFLEGLR